MPTRSDRLKALVEADPETALKLLRNLSAKTVSLHPAQVEISRSPARFKAVNAGRRFGKTKFAAHAVLKRARADRKMIWWVAPTYKVVKRGYREVLRQLPDGVLNHTPPPDTNFDAGRSVILRFKNGSRIEFYSAERPEGMLGEGVDYAVLDEAATMPNRIWEQIVRPTLMDRHGEALLISTPRGHNWFYQAHKRGQDPQNSSWASWTFPTASNPYITDDEIEDMESSLPRLLFEQEVLAEFLAAGSSVFVVPDNTIQYEPILDTGLVEGVAPQGHVVLGIDLAKTTDFTVLYGARARDRRNVYFERLNSVTWGEQKRRIARAVKLLRKNGASGVTLVMDSTGVGDPIVEDMEERGYDVVPINFTTHKANMVKLLAKELEDSRAFILEEGQKSEFDSYAMDITPGGRMTYGAPSGDHDDAVSAKMLQTWGLINEGVPEATILSADDPDEDDPLVDLADDADPWDLDEVEEALEAIGLSARPPTVQELLARPEVWDSYA